MPSTKTTGILNVLRAFSGFVKLVTGSQGICWLGLWCMRSNLPITILVMLATFVVRKSNFLELYLWTPLLCGTKSNTIVVIRHFRFRETIMQRNKPFKTIAMAVVCLATVLGQVNLSFGQTDLADADRATAMFDIQLDKMRDGDFAEALGDDFENLFESMPEEGIRPDQVNRVSGMMTIPNSMEEFEAMQVTPMAGMDYIFKIEFSDTEAVETAVAKMKEEGDPIEVDGNTYYTNSEVEGMLTRRINDSTIEMGTEKYLTQPSRDLLSTNLKAAFGKTADVGFRFVVDLESESDLVTEAMNMAATQSGGDAMAAGMIQLMDNMSDLRLTFDLDAPTMLSLAMTGNNEEDAVELQGGLDGMLGMAKMFGGPATEDIPDPELSKAAKSIVNGLKATRDGNNVSIDIARPANLVEAVKAAIDMAPGLPPQT